MCIRDSLGARHRVAGSTHDEETEPHDAGFLHARERAADVACLLYTSDAADERSSVDLGGRRIIKKKKGVYSKLFTPHQLTVVN